MILFREKDDNEAVKSISSTRTYFKLSQSFARTAIESVRYDLKYKKSRR